MINLRQLDRLVIKMVKLKDYYQSYLVRGEQEQSVLLNGKPILHGQEWGEDFGYGKFTFTYKKCFQNPYLYVDNGGVENLLLHSGKPFGLTDDIPNGRDAIFRTHKYVSLAEIEEGEEIEAEAYASHTFYGTAPYAGKQTFSINGYREKRVFNKISVVDIDADVKAFSDRSNLLVSYFRCMKDGDARKIAAYQTYQALFDGISALPDTPPVAEELRKAVALMDAFFESLKGYGAQNEPFVSLIGHSHLDTAWLWTVEETRHKAVRTAANAVTLLKAYPQYRFVMSSVLYLDWIRLDYPSLFEDIRALTREGRFEPNGATWVECDCNLCDGESIVRQFLRGKRFMKQYFNYEPDVFWLPDTFGYSAALPQILKGCRVPYFLTTKLSWNDTNKFPYDSFVWRGIDGSEVLVHFNTIQSKADPEFITSRIEGRLNKHLTKNVLIAYGYGDGGGGPERSMVEEAIRTQESYPYARVAHTTVSQFMQALSEEELPVYEGELYLELHRGTLTTNHDIKRLNRALEGALKDAELLSVSTCSRAVKALTDSVYDTLMLNQFHDILPGTCIEEVHTLAIRQNEEALRSLYGYLSGDRYFNTLGFMREELLPAKDGAQSYTDFDGNTLSVDLFRFPAYGYGERVAAEGNPFTVDGLTFTTPFYRATVQKGAISSLVFRGREIAEGLLNEIRMYEDVPNDWDNWDIDADYERKPRAVECLSCEVISVGALELRVRSVYRLGEHSTLTQDTVFYAHNPAVVFESKLDWNDHHKLIKADFSTNIMASTFKSEVQFGFLERPTTRNTSEEQAKYEVCNHKWTDLSETRFGVALLNQSKYGVSVRGKRMGLSLLKSGRRPDTSADCGVKYFNYALLPHEGGFSAESVVLPAYAFNRAPVAFGGEVQVPVCGISQPNVICETVKYAEDSDATVLRIYECERSYTDCVLTLSGEYEVYQTDMLEENPVLLATGSEIPLHFNQFEIKTLLLKKK